MDRFHLWIRDFQVGIPDKCRSQGFKVGQQYVKFMGTLRYDAKYKSQLLERKYYERLAMGLGKAYTFLFRCTEGLSVSVVTMATGVKLPFLF